ncbi:MAG: hypothetical protein A2Z18_09640 [Armatimonadetes bacterium RBG_16_58_9]|nr:MAG: hypothetical protein A2Z18_09640 [Armatimonadetes bacterium RBG_16_58_9]
MEERELLKRISLDPKVMLGKPVITGTRLTVEYVLDRLAHGATAADLVEEYDGLSTDDIAACLLFARQSLSDTDYFPLAQAS